MDAVVAENVNIYYERHVAVAELTFKISEGEVLLLLGPNGAGKTTLLRTLAGLHTEYTGKLHVFNKPPVKSKELVSYVPQSYSLNEKVPLTVIEVVAMGGIYKKSFVHYKIPEDVLKAAEDALNFVGLKGMRDRLFKELSGGQKQRVLLARALISNPKLLLLDEPFSALDPSARMEVSEILSKIKKERGTTMIISTHDINPLIDIGDKVLLLNKRLIAFGTPEEVLLDEIISRVYGPSSRAVRINGKLYCIIGDVHIHRGEKK